MEIVDVLAVLAHVLQIQIVGKAATVTMAYVERILAQVLVLTDKIAQRVVAVMETSATHVHHLTA
jgi:hypothetical protein